MDQQHEDDTDRNCLLQDAELRRWCDPVLLHSHRLAGLRTTCRSDCDTSCVHFFFDEPCFNVLDQRPALFFVSATSISPIHQPSGVSRLRMRRVGIFFKEVWGGCVGRVWYDTVCAQSCFDTVDRTLLRLAVPNGHHRFSRCRPVSSGAALRLVTPDSGRRARDTTPVLPSCDRVGKLRDEFGVSEDDRCVEKPRPSSPGQKQA